MPNYNGFKVELLSDELGSIVGIVEAYNNNQIDLAQAIVNGNPVGVKHYSVDKKFIKQLRILSTTPEEVTPVKDVPNASRNQRRDRLRNIPNTCNAYVCPNSPPRMIKTPKNQFLLDKSSKSLNVDSSICRMNTSVDCGKQQLHRSESAATSTQLRNRSKSAGDGFIGSDDISSCESEPAAHRGGSQQRKHSRNGGNSFCGGENSSKNGGWNSIRVEDFIDEDFDFEANLALFDKQAFYDLADAHATGAPAPVVFPTDEQVLVEGPNGIGFVPKRKCKQASSPKRPEEDQKTTLQQKDKPQPSFTSSPKQAKCSNTLSGSTSGGGGMTWISPTGQRVPVLSQATHRRLLRYLATGHDEGNDGDKEELPIGLAWQRIVEVAGRVVVDSAITYLRQTGRSSLRPYQTRHPLRVLVLPGGPNLGGVLAVNIARQLATRGACVLLHPTAVSPTATSSKPSTVKHPEDSLDSVFKGPSLANTSQLEDIQLGGVFRSELTLTRAYAPKITAYGDLEDGFEEDEDEEEVISTREVDGEELSQVGRMWVSRISGLKVVGHPSSVTCRQKNLTIDLLILGQPIDQLDPNIRAWLSNHTSICLSVQLAPQLNRNMDLNSPPQSVKSWLVQLGLPVLPPTSSAIGQSDVHLVDVGMTRALVSMITGDLRLLPPLNLFDASSFLRLEALS